MDKRAKIYVAGHQGLVGSAILSHLLRNGYSNLLVRTHLELDLTCQAATEKFFATQKPDYVFLAAAKVGGIFANSRFPAQFIYENLAIQTNVIHASYKNQVTRMIFLGSSCIYPKLAPQPIKEEYLLSGKLEPTNRSYALAKISGIEMCSSYNHQYGTRFLATMPTNLYGPGDNYHPENSHVIPALIAKFCDAHRQNAQSVYVWGSGKQKREFLYSEDLADACVFLMCLPDESFAKTIDVKEDDEGSCFPIINIGMGEDITLCELAMLIKTIVGFQGNIIFDTSKPDGTPRKLLDISRMNAFGWKAKTTLEEGLRFLIDAYLSQNLSNSVKNNHG